MSTILNPRRVFTRSLRTVFLNTVVDTEVNGALNGLKAQPVKAVTIPPDQSTITDVERITGDFGDPQSLVWTAPVAGSSTGKLYKASGPLTFVSEAMTASETCIGVVLTTTDHTTGVKAFLEFDEPVEVDELNDSMTLSVEIGFDGQDFYAVPRVMPLGS